MKKFVLILALSVFTAAHATAGSSKTSIPLSRSGGSASANKIQIQQKEDQQVDSAKARPDLKGLPSQRTTKKIAPVRSGGSQSAQMLRSPKKSEE